MRGVSVVLLLALAGCADNGAEAERRYEMVKRTESRGEICDAGKAVAAAYLQAGNEEKYRLWHGMSETDCLIARLEGRDGRPGEVILEAIH